MMMRIEITDKGLGNTAAGKKPHYGAADQGMKRNRKTEDFV